MSENQARPDFIPAHIWQLAQSFQGVESLLKFTPENAPLDLWNNAVLFETIFKVSPAEYLETHQHFLPYKCDGYYNLYLAFDATDEKRRDKLQSFSEQMGAEAFALIFDHAVQNYTNSRPAGGCYIYLRPDWLYVEQEAYDIYRSQLLLLHETTEPEVFKALIEREAKCRANAEQNLFGRLYIRPESTIEERVGVLREFLAEIGTDNLLLLLTETRLPSEAYWGMKPEHVETRALIVANRDGLDTLVRDKGATFADESPEQKLQAVLNKAIADDEARKAKPKQSSYPRVEMDGRL